jgi:hypothetical protein
MAAWIFQGSHKFDDEKTPNYVEDNVEIRGSWDWEVAHRWNKVKKGDRAYIWVAEGGNPKIPAGIIASGIITCDPEMREGEKRYIVDIEHDRKFVFKRVLKETLKADERTKDLEVIRMAFGKNPFSVTDEEEEVIESIIDGTYEQVPLDGTFSAKQ